MTEHDGGLLGHLKDLALRVLGRAQATGAERSDPAAGAAAEQESPCCWGGVVHIAYRGVSDDRMYVAYGRKWVEVKYFKPRGLRVFCAACRRRIL